MASVYTGGIPTGGFDTNLNTSNEAEFGGVPNQSEAKRPSVVRDGASGPGKTYDKAASQDFLLNDSYQANELSINRVTDKGMDIDNPDDISHADHNDDPDL